MISRRKLPLFDATVHPSSWNERMAEGEYAVLDSSSTPQAGTVPSCTVFGSLVEAEIYAREQVLERPELRCRIYNHYGLGRQPVRELRGCAFQGESEITPRFRRWVGSTLFFGGLALTIVDWAHDFSLSWPAMIGTRMLFPGFLLLFIEAMVILQGRRSKTEAAG